MRHGESHGKVEEGGIIGQKGSGITESVQCGEDR